MCRCSSFIAPALLTVAGIAAVAGSIAFAQPGKDTKPGTATKPAHAAQPTGQPEMQLPPGWTAEDMMACQVAGTPGDMHEFLAKLTRCRSAKTKMWMPGSPEPMVSDATYIVTDLMDGRYIKGEMKGEMPGMGPFNGFALAGYDNVAQKFVGTWVDNHSTGIMNGTGELSKDGKTINWSYNHYCPITKKPTTMRKIETLKGLNEMTLEMHGMDPKSGKEYKMMEISFTRTGAAPTAAR